MSQEQLDITRDYYDSKDADEFYYHIWGGEDIHVGIYKDKNEEIAKASRRTVQEMANIIAPRLSSECKVLDIGSGYGGSARYLAQTYNCEVYCLNLSKTENARNFTKNEAAGLNDKIKVYEGNFEEIPFEEQHFDFVWSQDAILHSSHKPKVFTEVARVLKSGGEFIFTDPMQADNCPEGVLSAVLERIHLERLGAVAYYRDLAKKEKLSEVQVLEMPEQLGNHYRRVYEELTAKQDMLKQHSSVDYIERMKKGLKNWTDASQKNYLNWGILHFRKA